MGRSAKFHKRQNKKTTSSASAGASVVQPAPKVKVTPVMKDGGARKRTGLKAKAKAKAQAQAKGSKRAEGEGPVLGGADYVELMLGSRRKAAAEAAKLPREREEDEEMS